MFHLIGNMKEHIFSPYSYGWQMAKLVKVTKECVKLEENLCKVFSIDFDISSSTVEVAHNYSHQI
jgi:hypothetical protein